VSAEERATPRIDPSYSSARLTEKGILGDRLREGRHPIPAREPCVWHRKRGCRYGTAGRFPILAPDHEE
jgi:hypothetical protein